MKPRFHKRFLIIVCLLLTAGCTPGMRQSWIDFKAYYNTFYNAERYFNTALETQNRELGRLNPERPVRIYQSPSGAGTNEFNLAIETASEIISDHSESGYYWQAHMIVGRSHFYTGNFFTALETFGTIYEQADAPRIRANAVVWEGRSYLEMGVIDDGIRIINDKLQSGNVDGPGFISEATLVLADMYVLRDDPESAIDVLFEALPVVSDLELRARGYFLLGQLYQLAGSGREAIEAYSSVLDSRPGFELEYQARRKTGEAYREMGSYDLAFQQFRLIERDDKFRDRQPEIGYEMARTVHLRGDLPLAQTLYRTVLDQPSVRPDAVTLAKTYYSIGEVYENINRDYSMAAAYYDSSRSQQVEPDLLPPDWQPEMKARAYGEFARIVNEIAYRDSLLKLGMMTPEERDAVLDQISQERRQSELVSNRGIQTPVPPDEMIYGTTVATATEYGFLNVNNRVLQNSESREFREIWGERPLVDNWRWGGMISGIRSGQSRLTNTDVSIGETAEAPDSVSVQSGTVSDIPITQDAQEVVREELHVLYFQLANVYLQNLQNSDSASVYFNKVLESDYADHLKAQAIYGLADIAFLKGDQGMVSDLATQLLNDYPDSEVTRLITERLGFTYAVEASTDTLQSRYSDIISDTTDSMVRAGRLNDLALAFSNDSRSAQILLDAAREYLMSIYLFPDHAQASVDSANVVLSRIESLYPDSPANTRAQLIRNEIREISSGSEDISPSTEEDSVNEAGLPDADN